MSLPKLKFTSIQRYLMLNFSRRIPIQKKKKDRTLSIKTGLRVFDLISLADQISRQVLPRQRPAVRALGQSLMTPSTEELQVFNVHDGEAQIVLEVDFVLL
jgi:hypothetical protein